VLLAGKMVTKSVGVYPVTRAYRSPRREAADTILLMSNGLTVPCCWPLTWAKAQ